MNDQKKKTKKKQKEKKKQQQQNKQRKKKSMNSSSVCSVPSPFVHKWSRQRHNGRNLFLGVKIDPQCQILNAALSQICIMTEQL